MNDAKIIQTQLKRIGNKVYLKDGDWVSTPFHAVLNHLWRKKSSAFEGTQTELGKHYSEYYLYIGPFDHNIKSLSDDALLTFGDDSYEFKNRDSVKIDDEIIYYTAVVRKITEGNYDDLDIAA
ncbi:MAG: hypothetical protein LIO62_03885 [Clostridiales bacterium]|nr:hypothetical protein [Clostridiales bacterium]